LFVVHVRFHFFAAFVQGQQVLRTKRTTRTNRTERTKRTKRTENHL
jgi:hypothetical protein